MIVENGYGSCTLNDGSSYFGNFKNSQPDGYGTMILATGECYAGYWQNGLMHGVGKWYDSDKREFQGVWYEGALIHRFNTPQTPPSPGENQPHPQPRPESPVTRKERLALVIGNNRYIRATPLRNCVNDAQAFSEKLRHRGFDVITQLDGGKAQMDYAISEFCRRASNYDTALFFYTGHGIQHSGKSYIIPVDFTGEYYVEDSCCCVDDVITSLDRANCQLKIAILDACRSNTKDLSLPLGKGLSNINASGVFIAYATGPGQVASDGAGEHSPYMAALLRMLEEPNLPLSAFFREVSKIVYHETARRQMPWTESCLVDDNFCFYIV